MGRMRFEPRYGSHLPILMKVVSETTGPILELGCGLYSTNPLHWACHVPQRRLVTYENKPEYYEFLRKYETDWHEVHCIESWDGIDISEQWAVAFVDHDPEQCGLRHRRFLEVQRLTHADYVVVHDTERENERQHRLSEMNALFKYRYRYRDALPNTTIFSNTHDVTKFLEQ